MARDPGTGSRSQKKRRRVPPAPKPVKQAVIWAAEQNLKPWDLPPPKPKKTDREELQALKKRPRTFTPAERRAPVRASDLKKTEEIRYRQALAVPVSAKARQELAKGLTPQRRQEIQNRVLPPSPPLLSVRGLRHATSARRRLGEAADLIGRGSAAAVDLATTDRQQRLYGDAFGALEEQTARAQEAITRKAEERGQSQGAAAAAGFTGSGIGELVQDTSDIVGTLATNLSQAIVGAPVGAINAVKDPVEAAGEIVDAYKEMYGPLFRGDWEGFIAQLDAHPEMVLDLMAGTGTALGVVRRLGTARAVASGAARPESGIRSPAEATEAVEALGTTPARAALRSIVTNKVPERIGYRETDDGVEQVYGRGKVVRTRYHKVDGETTPVQMYTMQSPLGYALGGVLEGARGQVAGLTSVLPKRLQYDPRNRRFRKGKREDVEAIRSRVFGELQAFRAASRDVEADATQSKAFDRMLIQGGDPALVAGRIRREIEVRESSGMTETQAQTDEINRLNEAAAYLETGPSPHFLEIVERGRAISRDTQQVLMEAGLLNERTAERMLLRPVQFLEGPMPEVASPMRTRIEEMLQDRYAGEEGGAVAVETAMSYLDMNAVSYGRRTGATPQEFYETFYKEASYSKTTDVAGEVFIDSHPDDLLYQRGDPTPFLISEENSRIHRKAHLELRKLDPEETKTPEQIEADYQAALEKALPKFRERITTIPQRLERILAQLGTKERRAEIGRWYHDIWPVFERYFGADVENAVRGFLASQAAMSPADGLLTMMKLLAYKNENGHWPEDGFLMNQKAIINAWDNANMGTDPYGVQAKISDFFDSGHGADTRTFLEGIAGTAPGVVDRWTLRSDGFLDYKSYSYPQGANLQGPNTELLKKLNAKDKNFKKREADGERLSRADRAEWEQVIIERDKLAAKSAAYYDMGSGPDPYQYEWSSIRLVELRDHINAERLDGRSDWTVDEVQAMDWFATREEWGVVGGGWDDTFARQKYTIISDAIDAISDEWLQQGSFGGSILSRSSNGTHSMTEVMGSMGQAFTLAQRLADETGGRAYHFYEPGGSERRGEIAAQVLDITDDPDVVHDTLGLIVDDLIEMGVTVLPYGDGRTRLVFRKPDGQSIPGIVAKVRRDKLAARLTEMGIDNTPSFVRMDVYHAAGTKPSAHLHRRVDPGGILARAAAAQRRGGAEFRVRELDGRTAAAEFSSAFGASLTDDLPDDYAAAFVEAELRGFVTDDGLAGAAIAPDGEITALFDNGSFEGAAAQVLAETLARGGSWLEILDGPRATSLSVLGFREVARVSTKGQPDQVFMAYTPHKPIRRAAKPVKTVAGARLRAKAEAKKGMAERPAAVTLTELADRGDGIPHAARNGEVLAQWKRPPKTDDVDPVLAGAVRLDDDGAHVAISPAANFSTMVHENAHAMLRGTLEWLRQGNDPRLEEVQRLLKIKDVDGSYDRYSQELFARAVEYHTYLGNLPAPQLRQMRSEHTGLMKDIYGEALDQLVANDDFTVGTLNRLLESTPFSSLLDDLVNVAYGVERRSDAVFMPRLPPTSHGVIGGVIKRVTSTMTRGAYTPPRTRVIRKGNLGKRFESGEYAYGPGIISDYASSVFREKVAEETAREVYHSPFTKPLTRGEDGRLRPDEGYRLFVYKRAPDAARMLDRQIGAAAREEDLRPAPAGSPDPVADLDPQEVAIQIRAAAEKALEEEVFPKSVDELRLEALHADGAIKQVPNHIHNSYVDALAGTQMLSGVARFYTRDLGLLGQALMAPFSALNVFARLNMILKPAYVVTNTIGTAAVATAHNPFWLGEIRHMTDLTSNFDPETLRILDEMGGAGTLEIAKVLEEEQSVLGAIGRKERELYTKAQTAISWPERRIRRSVVSRELRAAGYGTNDDIKMLHKLADTDPHFRAIYNQASRNAEEAAIRFRGMNETEKFVVRRAFFVYGWIRAAFRYSARFPFEHPVQAALFTAIGREGWEDMQDALEKEIGFRGGLVTKITETEAGKLVRMLDLSGIMPFATGAQVTRSLLAPAVEAGGGNLEGEAITDMFSEGISFGLTYALGETPYGESLLESISKAYGPGKGYAGIPALNWISRITDPKVTETTTFSARTRKDVVMSFLLGAMWPRETKVDGAHAAWLRRQPVTISAPLRIQAASDLLRERYTAASKVDNSPVEREVLQSLDAHDAYELATALRRKELDDLDDDEAEIERAKIKMDVLKQFFPESYASLRGEYGRFVPLEEIDYEYNEWVSQGYSDARQLIEDMLGKEKVPD